MQSTLGERLKILRHNNNMTQEEVSKYLNVQRQSYSHYENDKRMPSLDILIRLTKLYSISLTSLLDAAASYEEEVNNVHLIPLNQTEAGIICDYRALSPVHQNDVLDYLAFKKFVSGRKE
ncbi:helix-turn-helix transcriptional regulator [Murimonas intestini]|uniref:DNA-binding XRE family transcriptional regulator n=1 Tax=Murimonas intestini TaxID=1337051 RepID=A0AB73T2K4_9FIRM|nr:helix-turn-helix transcriptional regulator [Murimonas intestini]MCR1841806.1 helix-turn-helix domain-containing protein [Murimonas intestini]MCR1865623.1 helix-turn-helix domain-containing protein [Murimonas intestini]MCR1883796.1 helix-turn-helix domain-containing protein [Murimonas intestini]